MFASILCSLACVVFLQTLGEVTCDVTLGEAACQFPCIWDSGCTSYVNEDTYQGCCHDPSCGDSNHNSAGTCPNTGGVVCVWNPDRNSCDSPSCGDYNHWSQQTCIGSDDRGACVWNPVNLYCQSAGCNDYNHNTAQTCIVPVNGRDCIWNPTGGYNPTTGQPSGSCQAANCGSYGHDTEQTCKGFVSEEYCLWDADNNNCGRTYCGNADDKTECSAMPSEMGCQWINRGTKCQWCDNEAFDCHWFDDDEEECKDEGAAACGCSWSNGKCGDSGAFRVVIPSLLAWILLALLF